MVVKVTAQVIVLVNLVGVEAAAQGLRLKRDRHIVCKNEEEQREDTPRLQTLPPATLYRKHPPTDYCVALLVLLV